MPLNNVVKKFEKSREKIGISPDEQILAGCMTDPKAAVGLAIGGVAGAAVQSAIDKKTNDRSTAVGRAASWPTGRHLLAITSKRVVICRMSAMTGKPKEVVVEWPHGDITAFDIEKKATGYPFAITFVDGSVAHGEGARGTGADLIGDTAASIWN
ncbi:MAG: hypothetical protein ABJH68_07185 [Ilumatobacter sp.]|uniref:hypothetical protein n=1 Tax=Ilumatobacter sp. TaxID=1967498 RepID=UPI003296EDD3